MALRRIGRKLKAAVRWIGCGHDQGLFENAHNFNIEQFNVGVGSKTLYDYLAPHIAEGAAHNADERCDAPKCHPETRKAVQEEIMNWVTDGDKDEEPKSVLWLTGPAGTGKTAIAGTIAEHCHERECLAGSFFFSSFSASANRRSKRCFISTLAHDLSKHTSMQPYKRQLLICIESHPDIFSKRLTEQAERLILDPLRQIQPKSAKSGWPTLILIDGLDEVEAEQYLDPVRQGGKRGNEDDQHEILEALLTLAKDPAFPFRILVASRPERIITEFFTDTAQARTLELFLDSKYNPDRDIELYLKSKFTHMRRQYDLPESWPTQEAIEWIIDRASGQFVFATTVIQFVTDSSDLPQRQLEYILRLKQVATGSTNPFAPLDSLYQHIIGRSGNCRLAATWILSISLYSSANRPAQFWRKFLETMSGESHHVMGRLNSLISNPPSHDLTSVFKVHHKSLVDFLLDESRCGELFVGDRRSVDTYCADRCITVLQNKGPSVAFQSRRDLEHFLRDFLNFGGLVVPDNDEGSPDEYALFMSHLSEQAKESLASCDVAWWLTLSTTGRLDGVGTRQFLTERMRERNSLRRLLQGISHSVHDKTCVTNDGTVTSPCHAACIRWSSVHGAC